jgi:hypothetical protein
MKIKVVYHIEREIEDTDIEEEFMDRTLGALSELQAEVMRDAANDGDGVVAKYEIIRPKIA